MRLSKITTLPEMRGTSIARYVPTVFGKRIYLFAHNNLFSIDTVSQVLGHGNLVRYPSLLQNIIELAKQEMFQEFNCP